jgi:tRNA threonylcarbamoyladenosine dehydratase
MKVNWWQRNMLNEFSRTQLLLGEEAMTKLKNSVVAVFGIGGVGTYVAEALARSGVGGLVLFDDDKICLTNINRQLIATRKTIGMQKVEVMRDRILDINPDASVEIHECFYTSENADEFDLSKYSYIVDAIDTVSSKLELIVRAEKLNVPIISCMGAGNKLDPTRLEVADIYKTSVCPLARVMRKELKVRGIQKLKVVYSKEPPITPLEDMSISCRAHCVCPPGTKRKCTIRRAIPGSVSFVPSVAGLILAGEVIKDISGVSAAN